MKFCNVCKTDKDESEFGVRKASKDGLANRCKKCQSDYDRCRANLPHRVKARKEYSLTDRGKEAGSRAKKKWVEVNTVKRAAHIILGNALKSGRIVKLDCCEECGHEGDLHGHHDDYEHPLGVTWLCSQCHNDWHKRNGEGRNG